MKPFKKNHFNIAWTHVLCLLFLEFIFLLPASSQKRVKDIDGNVYRTVKIGNQIWIAENLKTIHYSDGRYIHNVADSADWNSLNTGAYCFYANDSISNRDINGALYNWYAVQVGKLCPAGWHVPSHKEWDDYANYLKNNGFGYLENRDEIGKSIATKINWVYWQKPGTPGNNQGINNSSGFSACPSGYRYNYGKFNDMNLYGTWWSSTESEYSKLNAWSRGVYYKEGTINRSTNNKNCGFSIRCLKD
jgi:uncharacterized protein (TIGR02145 family)